MLRLTSNITRRKIIDYPHSHNINQYLNEKYRKTLFPKVPKTLSHYTTASGLRGILETGELWATNVRFLSDFSEFTYGIELCREIANRLVARSQNEHTSAVIESMMKYISSPPTLEDYVCCFSEDGDLLSQWRGYTNQGRGYSISFDFSRLGLNLAQTAGLNKIIYNKKTQTKIIKDIFLIGMDYINERFLEKKPHMDHYIEDTGENLKNVFHQWISRFKHPSYFEENEWRLSMYRYPNDKKEKDTKRPFGENELEFRIEREIFIPYMKIPFGKPRNLPRSHYSAKKIIIGPTHDFDLCEEGIRRFLSSLKKKSISVSRSHIPLRDV